MSSNPEFQFNRRQALGKELSLSCSSELIFQIYVVEMTRICGVTTKHRSKLRMVESEEGIQLLTYSVPRLVESYAL